MSLSSYRVLSSVYIKPLSPSPAPKVAREEHNSYKFIPLTETSWPDDGSLPSKPHSIRGPRGESLYLRKTSNNTFITDDFERHGDFSPQIDDVNRYNPNSFGKWRYAAEQRPSRSFEYIKLPKETDNSGVMVSLGERRAEFPLEHTPLPKYVSDLKNIGRRNNEIGPALSRIETVRQNLEGYLRTRNGRELASYMTSLDFSPEDIDYIGEGFLPDTAIYGVDRTKDGKVLLTSAKDAYSKIIRDARLFGIEPEGLLNSILAEELVHIWRRDFDKDGDLIDIEMSAKDIVAKHYARLAKGADGEPKKAELKRWYQKLAAIKRYDRDTTRERYGKGSLFYRELYSKNKAALESILASEAIDCGYTGENIMEYVASRLKEIGEEDKTERGSRLETIAKEGKEMKPTQTEKESSQSETADDTLAEAA